MALQKSVVPITFQGLNTKIDDKHLIPGEFLTLENVVYTTPLRLTKRNGYSGFTRNVLGTLFSGNTTVNSPVITSVSATTNLFVGQVVVGLGIPANSTIISLDSATQITISNSASATNSNVVFSTYINVGTALATFKNELDLFSGAYMYSYSAGNGLWSNKGNATSVNLTTNSVIKNSYQQTTQDMAFHPLGIKLFTWEDTRGGSRYSVVDAETNEILVSDTQIASTATRPKPFALGSYIVILYIDSGSGNLIMKYISAANPNTLSSAVTVASNVNATNNPYDAAILGTDLIVAYNSNAAGGAVNALYITPALLVSAAVATTSESATACINVATDPILSQIWVSYFNGAQVKGFVLGAPLQPSTTVTVNNATPGVATLTSGSTSGFYSGMSFTFQQGPGGTAAGGTSFLTTYYITTILSTTTFNFSATLGGSNINTSSASSGTIYLIPTNAPLSTVLSPHSIATVSNIRNIAGYASNGKGTFWYEIDGTQSISCSNASPTVATVSDTSALYVGQSFQFQGSGTPVTNASKGVTYYITSKDSGTTFKFSSSLQGSNLNAGGAQSGSLSFVPNNPINSIRYNTMTNAGVMGTTGAGSGTLFLKGVGLASKVISYSNLQYFAVAFQSPLQSTYFLVNNNADIVAKFAPQLGGGFTAKSILPELVSDGTTGLYSLAYLLKNLLETQVSSTNQIQVYTQTGVQESVFNFLSTYSYLTSELANNLHISGGFLSVYDGTSVVEHNYHYYPENVTAIASTSGGSMGNNTDNSQYQYKIVYEWTDNQGQTQRSTAIPLTVTYFNSNRTTAGSVVLTIPTLRLTKKQTASVPSRTPVTISVYRTEANGTTFYKVSSITSPTLNDVTVDYVTYTDTKADSAILASELIYTTGGVLDDSAAPAISAMTTYRDRIIAIPSENPLQFWYSKDVVPGQPVQFSDFQVQNFDVRGGGATAIQQMDDKLILFKQTEVFLMSGNGPDGTGANNDFSDLQLITTDSGSVGPFVVVTPVGLMYKSLKGIYLLDRGLSAHYIGAEVEAYNQYDIVSATLITEYNQVRFILTNQTALVYDYFVKKWSVFTNHNGVDATIFQNNFVYLQPTGTVMSETPGEFTDNGAFIKMKLVTGWLSFNQITGYQRLYWLMISGNYVSPHQLLVQVAYDYNTNFFQQTYIPVGDLLTTNNYGDGSPYGSGDAIYGGAFPYYEFRVQLEQQKCTAFQFSIEDVAQSPFGEGFSLSAVGVLVGAKKGLAPLVSKTRTFG